MAASLSRTTPWKVSPKWSGLPGAEDLAERLERGVTDGVKLLALTLDERAIILSALDDPPHELAELRAVLLPITSGGAAKGSTESCGEPSVSTAGAEGSHPGNDTRS